VWPGLREPDQERLAHLGQVVQETGVGNAILLHALDEAHINPENARWAEADAYLEVTKTDYSDTWDARTQAWVPLPPRPYRQAILLSPDEIHALRAAREIASSHLAARISINDRLGSPVASPAGELRERILGNKLMQDRLRASNFNPFDRAKHLYARTGLIACTALYAAGQPFPLQ
jgi:hypothetical protein